MGIVWRNSGLASSGCFRSIKTGQCVVVGCSEGLYARVRASIVHSAASMRRKFKAAQSIAVINGASYERRVLV